MTWMHSTERTADPQTGEFLKGVMKVKWPWRNIVLNVSYVIYRNRPVLKGGKCPECYCSSPGSSGVMFEEIMFGIRSWLYKYSRRNLLSCPFLVGAHPLLWSAVTSELEMPRAMVLVLAFDRSIYSYTSSIHTHSTTIYWSFIVFQDKSR